MGWTIEIDEGADQVIIDANARFALGFRANPTDNNEIDSIIYSLQVEGDIVAASPSLVATGFLGLADLVVNRGGPVRINIKLDGVSQWDLRPENGFTGPFVTSLTPTDSPGNGLSHWKYNLEAIFRSKNVGGGNENPEVYELVMTLSTAKDHDIVTRKVWQASAKGTSTAAAKAFVRKFKPSGDDIKEEIKEGFSPDAGAQAIWVWEALQKTYCEVTYEGGGRDYVEDPQVGVDKAPVLFLKQKAATMIRVRGRVVGYTPVLSPPAKHFSDSATMREVTAAPRSKPRIEQAENGLYVLHFEELWMCTAPTDPAPVHVGEHNLISLDGSKEPADGAIRT